MHLKLMQDFNLHPKCFFKTLYHIYLICCNQIESYFSRQIIHRLPTRPTFVSSFQGHTQSTKSNGWKQIKRLIYINKLSSLICNHLNQNLSASTIRNRVPDLCKWKFWRILIHDFSQFINVNESFNIFQQFEFV